MKTGRSPKTGILFALCAISLLLVFALNAGNLLIKNAPQRADVIVVLAGETDRRPARALALLNQGYAPRVLIDVPAGARIYDTTQLQLARKYVQTLPEAASVDLCPIEGLSTKAESHDVERCLAAMKASSVLIVTSDFHTRRALSIFRHELRDKPFSIAAAHDEAQFGARWWTHRQWAKTCFEEWLRLLWWNAVDRWK